jgi:phosphoglycolate phosphatase
MESLRICEEFMADYDSNPYYLTAPYAGIPEAIRTLSERGMKLAVISNKPDPTVKKLIEEHFSGIFEIVEGAKPSIPLKPDPTAILDICVRLGISAEETAYFGDTQTDMKTAKNYGAGIAVGVSWGFRSSDELIKNGADVIIDTPAKIPDICL